MKFKILNTLGLITVMYVNYLANSLPINGFTTGQLSDFYPNLFVPAGVTFSIWGIIYLFLTGFIVAQWLSKFNEVVIGVGYWFIINCLLNCAWIFVWHYRMEEISLVVMLLLLGSLIKLNNIIQLTAPSTVIASTFFKIPFSIYFGWICVATIANVTLLLVDWNFSPPSPEYWASTLIIVTQVLIWFINSKKTDIFYTLTIVWAISGIILKQTTLDGSEIIIYTGYACILSSIGIYLYQKLTPT